MQHDVSSLSFFCDQLVEQNPAQERSLRLAFGKSISTMADRYASVFAALNLRLTGPVSGDWEGGFRNVEKN